MRPVSLVLAQIVALVSTLSACASEDPRSGCGGTNEKITATPEVACGILSETTFNAADPPETTYYVRSASCAKACSPYGVCQVAASYVDAYRALNARPAADGGAYADAGPPSCPAVTDPIAITCSADCTGRRTAGIPELPRRSARDVGAYFADCAYLEAVSVHAFARLARELEAHGAPVDLVAWAKRAEDEERAHTRVMTALAERYGARFVAPEAPAFEARTLFAIARENAVEGCVRETFGAAIGLLQAARAATPAVRDAMRAVAADECGHADLSWAVAAWASSRLDAAERDAIAASMEEAARALGPSDSGLSSSARAALGLPSPAEQRELARLVRARIVHAPRAA